MPKIELCDDVNGRLAEANRQAVEQLNPLLPLAKQIEAEARPREPSDVHPGHAVEVNGVSSRLSGSRLLVNGRGIEPAEFDLAGMSPGLVDVTSDGSLTLLAEEVTGQPGYQLTVVGANGALPVVERAVSACFCAEGTAVLAVVLHRDDFRPDTLVRISLHDLANPAVVWREQDRAKGLAVQRGSSGRVAVVVSSSLADSRVWTTVDGNYLASSWSREQSVAECVDADSSQVLIVVRRSGHEDSLVSVPTAGGPARELARARQGEAFESVHITASAVYLGYRRGAVRGVRRQGLEQPHWVEIPGAQRYDEVHVVAVLDFELDLVEFESASFVRPPIRSRGEFPRTHPERDEYRTEHINAQARDGQLVPVTVLTRMGVPVRGALVYVYGSFGANLAASFSSPRLSLLDRGIAVVLAHVRGGGEFGEKWHRQAVGMKKERTWLDLIDVCNHLTSAGIVPEGKIVLEGNSAGGLAVAVAGNLAPALFAGVLATVPFVDPLATMMNAEHPLSAIEQDEWGDPIHDVSVREYIRSYSPVHQDVAPAYPAVLATTARGDWRVPPEGPLGWVDRLTAAGVSALLTVSDGGHDEYVEEDGERQVRALQLAWVLDRLS